MLTGMPCIPAVNRIVRRFPIPDSQDSASLREDGGASSAAGLIVASASERADAQNVIAAFTDWTAALFIRM